ncbi:MAG TPA: HD domain-containing protein [Methanocorpusculum sp.]|nr:HD domain-containing protein [Methanocorpusculum sp.]
MDIKTWIKKNKVFLAAVIIILILFSVLLGAYVTGMNKTVYDSTVTSMDEIAIQQESLIENYLTDNLNTLKLISAYYTSDVSPKNMNEAVAYLHSKKNAQTTFSYLALVTDTGDFCTESGSVEQDGEIFEPFAEIIQRDNFAARFDRTDSADAEERIIEFLYGVGLDVTIDGKHIIGILGKTPIDDLNGKLEIYSFDGRGHSSLIETDGAYIINQEQSSYSQKGSLSFLDMLDNDCTDVSPSIDEIRTKLQNREKFVVEYNENGVKKIALVHPVASQDTSLVIILPYAVYAEKSSALLYTSILVIIGVTLLFVLLGFFLSRQINKTAASRAEAKATRDENEKLEALVCERTADLKEKNLALVRMSEDVVELLGDVVESRDVESGAHIKRVKGFARILAAQVMQDLPEYKLDQPTVDLITKASALHDVGKISISDTILLKPGRFTPEEFAIMQSHCEKGCEILKKAPKDWDPSYLAMSMDICHYHHEKWDGKGYPCGLKGDEIPIAAQIVSVADIYDALVSKRCYKDSLSFDEAYKMICGGECGAFSDKLMACFTKCKDEFEEYAKSMKDEGE